MYLNESVVPCVIGTPWSARWERTSWSRWICSEWSSHICLDPLSRNTYEYIYEMCFDSYFWILWVLMMMHTLTIFHLLQGARGNDGLPGPAGPPVRTTSASITSTLCFFLKEYFITFHNKIWTLTWRSSLCPSSGACRTFRSPRFPRIPRIQGSYDIIIITRPHRRRHVLKNRSVKNPTDNLQKTSAELPTLLPVELSDIWSLQ